MADSLRVAMVAGEASGDLIAAPLMAALKTRRPETRFAGIGGPRMQNEGLESHYPMEKLSVRGIAEALRQVPEILGIRSQLTRRLLSERPDVYVGVDASDFNLVVEQRMKEAGIPSIHYVSPSVWAWRPWRVRRIARSVSRILVMFPFEEPIYQKAGVPVSYVGHPLADAIPLKPNKLEARQQLRLPSGKLVVALLPGSRRSELQYMAAPFILAAHRFSQEVPDVHFVCPTVTRETRDMFERTLYQLERTDLPLTLMFGHSHDALAAADLALVASGTATLEAALFKTPMVITYRQSAFSTVLMRALALVPYAGLPNILAGERLVPELLQDAATPAGLADALIALLRDTEAQKRQVARFQEFHETLRRNSAERAADAVLEVLDR